jgi:hypothetical protein
MAYSRPQLYSVRYVSLEEAWWGPSTDVNTIWLQGLDNIFSQLCSCSILTSC